MPEEDAARCPQTLKTTEIAVLRVLWEAEKPLSCAQVVEILRFSRRSRGIKLYTPATIAATLSYMTTKGLVRMEHREGEHKVYYAPAVSRAEIVLEVLDGVTMYLTGQTLRDFLLQHGGIG
jgi:predicted transcriptional regulator